MAARFPKTARAHHVQRIEKHDVRIAAPVKVSLVEGWARALNIEPAGEERETQGQVTFGQCRRELRCALGFRDRAVIKWLQLVRAGLVGGERRKQARQSGMRQRKVGIGGDREFIIRARLQIRFLALGRIVERASAQIGFICLDVARASRSGRIRRHPHGHRIGNRPCDLVFEGEDVAQRMIDGLRPFAEPGRPVGEVGRDPHDIARALHRAFE